MLRRASTSPHPSSGRIADGPTAARAATLTNDLHSPQVSQLPHAHHRVLPKSPPIQRRLIARRDVVSGAPLAFSWTAAVVNAFAYVWLLTNFLRMGLAVHTLDIYHTVEPNVYINFGPYAYPVNTFYKWSDTNVTASDDIALWSYKFDTTSLALRAFAEHLQVDAFPPCVLYRGKCLGDPGSEISPLTAFSMPDSLVTAFRNATAPAATAASSIHLRPQTMHLDASYEYFDRIHRYIAPKVFQLPLWRTCRALYYNPDVLSSVAASAAAKLASSSPRELQNNVINVTVADICPMDYGGVCPYFCSTLWARFDHSCRPWKPSCVAIGRVSTHLATRLGGLIDEYPNAYGESAVCNAAN